MAKLSTKNLTDKKVSKVLEPGNHIVEIVTVKLESSPFREGALHLNLNCQGPDLGKDFEGFHIDMNDPNKGRYTGKAGRIRCNAFPYSDGETKSGIKVYRDKDILKVLKNLCAAMGISSWFDDQDGKHDTIEQFVEQFDKDRPFADKKLRMCIGGREYQSRQGYTNYDLHIAKPSRGNYGYESVKVPEENSKVIKFDPSIHIPISKGKKKTETVASFEKPVTEETKNQFKLD